MSGLNPEEEMEAASPSQSFAFSAHEMERSFMPEFGGLGIKNMPPSRSPWITFLYFVFENASVIVWGY
jgi:hypothetical protein